MKEIWKDIPGYEGIYQASTLGNIRSLDRIAPFLNSSKRIKGRILSQCVASNGYKLVSLSKDSKTKSESVHQLIAITFLNHKKQGRTKIVDHINNDKLDNRVSNLQIITVRENRSKDSYGSSRMVGVSFDKKSKKWRANIYINKKPIYLGWYNSEKEASSVYQNRLNEFLKTGK